jgi:dTDP-4-amino-4,6-dideoxygalactose transaminase
LGYHIENYPKTYQNYAREISLPVYYDLSDEAIKTVANAVINAVEKIMI